MITRPTRVTQKTATLIDNIFTNNVSTEDYYTNGILLCDITDHFPVYHITNKVIQTKETVCIHQRKMNDSCKQQFLNSLSNCEWNHVMETNDAQEAYSKFSETYQSIYDKCFPKYVSKKRYDNKPPWLSEALRKSINHKNKLYKKAKKYCTAKAEIEYRKYKAILKSLMKSAEKKHYQDIFLKYKGNLRRTWSVIKQVINRNKQMKLNHKFTHNDKIITDGNHIVNLFNDFFINIGPTLANKIPKSDISPNYYLKNANVNTLYLELVNKEELVTILRSLKDSACGADELSPKIIKMSINLITDPLLHVCNKSLLCGIFPAELKIAKVVPIYKSGDIMRFTNYRPVSILPVLSKVLERLVYNRLLKFINKYQILYLYQFGFRQKHSTFMALASFIDKVTEFIDNGEYAIGVFLDFSKAFDTINHEILFMKLHHYGIRGLSLLWFKSYMSDRLQYVSYDNYNSTLQRMTCGVPQGSILGPLLFLLYINDLGSASNGLSTFMFADDTSMLGHDKNINSLQSCINENLQMVSEWLQVNKLSLNISKSHFMLFTRKRTDVHDIDIEINNINISRVKNVKFLGVILDEKMSWKDHINYISKKISKCIAIMFKLKNIVSKDTLKSLYYTLAYPYFIYCNVVWGNTFKTYMSPLIILQKRIIRILSGNVSRLAHTEPLFQKQEILKFNVLHQYQIAQFMYNFIKGDISKVFNDMFMYNSDVHHYNTRQSHLFHIPQVSSNQRKRTLRYEGPVIWNKLQSNVNINCSLCSFKRQLKLLLWNV